MTELRGMPVVRAMTEKLSARVLAMSENGIVPVLGIVRVGARADDLAYERGIKKRFSDAGAGVYVSELPPDAPQEAIENAVSELAEDDGIHGILVFRPLPRGIDEKAVTALVPPRKDVDCMTRASLAGVFSGSGEGFPPCTPWAVIELCRHYGIDLCGKNVALIGRSLVVGKPLAMLLLAENATVTVCHTKTTDVRDICRRADIIIAAAGRAKMVDAGYVDPQRGQTVIDVGINPDGDTICGDADYAALAPLVSAITPVPGGVGSITTAVLLSHTVSAAENADG